MVTYEPVVLEVTDVDGVRKQPLVRELLLHNL
jgi:hypothetical protein